MIISGEIGKKGSLFFLFLYSVFCHAQSEVSGIILDSNSNPVPDASISIVEQPNIGTVSDFNGEFSLILPIGSYTISVSYIGFRDYTNTIIIDKDKSKNLKIILKEDIKELSDVIVKGKTSAQRTREKAFEVEVLETTGLKNVSIDINTALTSIPGVNIRQRGGLGADFDFSLNGLSGKQVKFFIDGIPLENLGSSFSLNNFSASLIERAEIYKGVVPIDLGADALGGAVNLITNQKKNSFVDASYDIGSFNTQRATINGQYYGNKGAFIKLSSYYNYSDNDYTIDDIEIRDELGNDTGVTVDNVRRFHDAYSSQMINVKAGITDTSFADNIAIGITASGNKNEIQHPIDPQNPFGEVFTKNNILSGSIGYHKKNILKNISLKIYGSITKNREKVVDTSSRKYDWFGNFIERGDQSLGEFEFSKTLFEFEDDLHLINTLINYNINSNSSLNFSYTKNYIERKGEDPASIGRIAFENPHSIDKNIAGISYDFKIIDAKWSNSIFTKGYIARSIGVIEDLFTNIEEERFTDFNNSFEELGYGFATTYKILNNFQVKGSFEKTYRIPEGYEAFGDGFLLKSNPELLPETSYNANLGVLFNKDFDQFQIQLDSNIFLRESENFITIRSEGIFSRFYNTAAARSTGIEGEIKTRFNNIFFLNANITYQNIIDRNVGNNAGVDFLENQRIANIPYLFGNASVGTNFKNFINTNDQFNISWSSYYVNEYPLTSFIEGNPEDRDIIPTQLSHNIQFGYSFNNGTYNISASVRNITDAKIYDNFEIQQPGRAFYVKLRYYISN
ncbi:TonB-dependent receptor [Aquimarina addita]|uniref:TonB-dependent receptor n=1 Tax=Aquimarina addita TaxID=870485 RepID=A0ABP6UUH2_9FLAO